MAFDRWVSVRVLAAAIAGLAVASAPAAAKKKEEPPKAAPAAPAIAASKAYVVVAKKLSAAVKASDVAALEAALVEGDAAATTPGDLYYQAQYRLNLGLFKKDAALQSSAVDTMLASGLMPAADTPKFNFFSGQWAYNAKDYPKAIARLLAAKTAGNMERDLAVLLMDSYLKSDQTDLGLAVAREAIAATRAAGARPSEEFFVRPAQALQKAKRMPELLDFLSMRVRDYPAPATWRNTLFIHLQQAGADKDLALDVLRLMRATGAMTERTEYLEYVALATEGGLPGEVVSLISEGRAKGTILAKDAKFDELFVTQSARTTGDKAILIADAAKAEALPSAKRASSTGDALLGYGDFARAETVYAIALGKPGVDADAVNMRMGSAQLLAGKFDAAAASFAKVGGVRKRLADLWAVQTQNKRAAAMAPPPLPASPPAPPPAP